MNGGSFSPWLYASFPSGVKSLWQPKASSEGCAGVADLFAQRRQTRRHGSSIQDRMGVRLGLGSAFLCGCGDFAGRQRALHQVWQRRPRPTTTRLSGKAWQRGSAHSQRVDARMHTTGKVPRCALKPSKRHTNATIATATKGLCNMRGR